MLFNSTEARKLIAKVNTKDADAISQLKKRWENENDRKILITTAITDNNFMFFIALGEVDLKIADCKPNLFKQKVITPAISEALEKLGLKIQLSNFIDLPDQKYVKVINGQKRISCRDGVLYRHRLNQKPESISIPDLKQDEFLRIGTLIRKHGSDAQKQEYITSLETRPKPKTRILQYLANGSLKKFNKMPESSKDILNSEEALFIIESALEKILELKSLSAKEESYSLVGGMFESVLSDVVVPNYAIQKLISIVSYVVPMKKKPELDEDTVIQYLYNHSGICPALIDQAWGKYRDDEPDQSLLQSLKKIYAEAHSEGVKSPRPTSKRIKPSEWTAFSKEGDVVLCNVITGEIRAASSLSALPKPDTAPSEPVESATYTDAETALDLRELLKERSAKARSEDEIDTSTSDVEMDTTDTEPSEPDVDILGDEDTVRGVKRPASRRNDDEISDTETERSSDTARGIRRRIGGFVESTGTCEPINVLGR